MRRARLTFHVAAAPRLVSTEYPRRTRGVAATRSSVRARSRAQVLLGAKWTAELRAARPAELQAVQGHKLLALLDDFPTVRTRLLETALRRVAGAPILEVPAKPPRPKTPKKPRARGLLRTIGT